jgi:hypothetical protein
VTSADQRIHDWLDEVVPADALEDQDEQEEQDR